MIQVLLYFLEGKETMLDCLNNKSNYLPSTVKTRKWVKRNDQSNSTYINSETIEFKTNIPRSILWDFSDSYMVVLLVGHTWSYTFEFALINWEINIKAIWSEKCIISRNKAATLRVSNAKLCVPAMTQ